MKYSNVILDMLEQAVNGQIDNFWDFSFKFNALYGEDEDFAEAWDNENPEMFDALNDFELMMFLEEHDPSDKQGFINFLTPYYEQVKQLVNHSAQNNLGLRQKSKIKAPLTGAIYLLTELIDLIPLLVTLCIFSTYL